MTRSDTARMVASDSLSPAFAARRRSFAWWRSWSRSGCGCRYGMTMSFGTASGPRARPRRTSGGTTRAATWGGLGPARGPGGVPKRSPEPYRRPVAGDKGSPLLSSGGRPSLSPHESRRHPERRRRRGSSWHGTSGTDVSAHENRTRYRPSGRPVLSCHENRPGGNVLRRPVPPSTRQLQSIVRAWCDWRDG